MPYNINNNALYPVGRAPVQVPSNLSIPGYSQSNPETDPNLVPDSLTGYANTSPSLSAWDRVKGVYNKVKSMRDQAVAQQSVTQQNPYVQSNNQYRDAGASSDYVTTSSAKYRMTADGRILPNNPAPAIVENPMRTEVTGQDVINRYYNLAKNSTSAQVNGIYNTAKALAAKDGFNMDELINLRGVKIDSITGQNSRENLAALQPRQINMTQSGPQYATVR